MNFARPHKIFIVDDDPMLTTTLSEYLTRDIPHHITCFNTGEDCLMHLDDPPEIIILDYFLNSVKEDAHNGLEILDAIRKSKLNIKVIVLSSQDNYTIALENILKGGFDYVIKDKDAFQKIAKILQKI